MAESMLSFRVARGGLGETLFVSSAATHPDALGEPPHRGTREKLQREGIPLVPHRARLLTRADGAKYDYIFGMDEENRRWMRRILNGYEAKISLLLDGTPHPRDVADPWYTGDFEQTYRDLQIGIDALVARLYEAGKIPKLI